ncbi:MAG: hypothetical protein ACK4M7_10755, partial [Burkholderiales bacterium]
MLNGYLTAMEDESFSLHADSTKESESNLSSNRQGKAPGGKPTMQLGQKLIQKGLISSDQLEIALREQRSDTTHRMLGTILVELGFITESALGEVLAESSGIKRFELHAAALDPKLVNMIPKEVAIRCKAIPVAVTDDSISLAMSDVYNIMVIDQLRRYFPKHFRILPVYAGETEILEAIDQYYHYEMSVEGILKEIETGISDRKELNGESSGYVNPTVRLVDALLVD